MSHLIWKALLDVGTNPGAVFLFTVALEIAAINGFFGSVGAYIRWINRRSGARPSAGEPG